MVWPMSVCASWGSQLKTCLVLFKPASTVWGRMLLIVMPVVYGLSLDLFQALCFIQICYLIGEIVHFDSVVLYTKYLFTCHILK